MSDGEIQLAKTMFGDAVDYHQVRLANHRWWPLQPPRTVMAPTGCIHFHPGDGRWCGDFANAGIDDQGLFIHEMTHIWQTQRRGRYYLPLMRHPFCRYRYTVVAGRRFEEYGLEQQAEIMRHTFLARRGRTVPGMPSRAQLETIIAASFDRQLASQAQL